MCFHRSYNTFPNGYNLSPGEKFTQVIYNGTRARISEVTTGKPKNVKDNSKHEADNQLPKYIKHYVHGDTEGYRVSDHPGPEEE